MDALSDVLSTINLSGVIFLRANMGGKYGISMPPPTISHPDIKPHSPEHRLVMFHIVRKGTGYVQVEGYEAAQLDEGDLIIIFDDLFHSVVDTPGRECIDSSEVVPQRTELAAPPAATIGDGEPSMFLVCGMLQFVSRGFNPALSSLPPYLLIKRDEGPSSEWLQANLTHIIREAESGRPGGAALLSRLTELLFVETLRSYLDRLPEGERGWYAGLRDPIVGKALELMHSAPQRDWTVQELARAVGASRSAFSARFTQLLDMAPMTYLTRWRIRVAMKLLEDQGHTIAQIAGLVGYETEPSFHRAFKRETGVPPAAFRRRALGGPTPDAPPPN